MGHPLNIAYQTRKLFFYLQLLLEVTIGSEENEMLCFRQCSMEGYSNISLHILTSFISFVIKSFKRYILVTDVLKNPSFFIAQVFSVVVLRKVDMGHPCF